MSTPNQNKMNASLSAPKKFADLRAGDIVVNQYYVEALSPTHNNVRYEYYRIAYLNQQSAACERVYWTGSDWVKGDTDHNGNELKPGRNYFLYPRSRLPRRVWLGWSNLPLLTN